MTDSKPEDHIELRAVRARDGDREALEALLREIHPDVYGLALRFLWHPHDAEDAAQEILIRVMKGLRAFRTDSRFRTWLYRVACNVLLTAKKKRMELPSLSFDELGDDLARGLSDEMTDTANAADHELLLQEVRIGCTHAMLLCLDRNHRIAYILGDILGLDHREAADALDIKTATFRKRLSRARAGITSFMSAHCGMVNPANACRCRRRVDTAIRLGRVDPSNLLFATSLANAKRFPQVLASIRSLEAAQRAAALYRSAPAADIRYGAFAVWLKTVIDQTA